MDTDGVAAASSTSISSSWRKRGTTVANTSERGLLLQNLSQTHRCTIAGMDSGLEQMVRELKDRQDILDCIMRYCRGIDRLDREALESVYHPDAVDDHGHFVGPASEYIDWVLDFHTTNQQRTVHHITTHLCDLDGDTAHTESYFLYRPLNRKPPFYNFAAGRYLDRFERRGGRWAIAERVCVTDVRDEFLDASGEQGDGSLERTARDRSDLCYRRPLTVNRSRFTV